MGISERKKKILAAVVDEYIRTAEPVGSKAIAQSGELHCSSATIRNELAELVSLGYLEQPHTSAGRVPTPMGYRMYVNELMEKQRLSLEETEELNRRLVILHGLTRTARLAKQNHVIVTAAYYVPCTDQHSFACGVRNGPSA